MIIAIVFSLISTVRAEPIEVKLQHRAAELGCKIESRVDGRVILNLDEVDQIGCRPMGPSRVLDRRTRLREMSAEIAKSLSGKSFNCEENTSTELFSQCDLNTIVGYQSAQVKSSNKCQKIGAKETTVCSALDVCRKNVIRFLSRDGASKVKSSFSEFTLKAEEVVSQFDMLLRSKNCPVPEGEGTTPRLNSPARAGGRG